LVSSPKAAYQNVKQLIASAPTLQYFYPRKHVTLQVDASEKGLGGALLQTNSRGNLQPVAFTSCTLTETTN